METVRDILNEHLTDPLRAPQTPSLSAKSWTNSYKDILNLPVVRLYAPTSANLDLMFGPEDGVDELRLDQKKLGLNQYRDTLVTEGDSVASFYRQVSTAVSLAFTRLPFVMERAELEPPEDFEVTEKVDQFFSFWHAGTERVVACGEFKRPGIIDVLRWRRLAAARSTETRLGKELRGKYAVKYKTPQVFCYDGDHLIIIQFRAETPAVMQSDTCPIDCMVVPRSPEEYGSCSIRMALYRLVSQGVRRCAGQFAPPLSINGYPRHHQYFSGRPMWLTQTGYLWDFVVGEKKYERAFDRMQYAWKWTFDDTDVVDEYGNIKWDTHSILTA